MALNSGKMDSKRACLFMIYDFKNKTHDYGLNKPKNTSKSRLTLKENILKISYPRLTSKTIITTKPIMVPKVAISVFSRCCDSGISSSTTTYIIAPAAKDKA